MEKLFMAIIIFTSPTGKGIDAPNRVLCGNNIIYSSKTVDTLINHNDSSNNTYEFDLFNKSLYFSFKINLTSN